MSLGIVIDEHKASFEVEPFNEATAVIKCNSKDDWKKYSVTFTADEELESDGSGLIVTNTGDSDLDVDMVSLMPEDTYKGHGLRKDLMEQLEAMHLNSCVFREVVPLRDRRWIRLGTGKIQSVMCRSVRK